MDKDELDLDAFLSDASVPLPDLSVEHGAIDAITSTTASIPSYVQDFDVVVPAAEVVVGVVPLEVIQAQEAELEAERIQKAKIEAQAYVERESLIAFKEKQTKERLQEQAHTHKLELAKRELQSMQVVHLQSKRLVQVFHQAEIHMKNVLNQQQAHVQNTYGAAETHIPIQARRYRAEWIKIPQPVEFHVHMLRAPKDKLPQGHYVILATVYDRLGGSPISWSVTGERGAGSDYPGITKPNFHRGHFYNTELMVNQSIYCVCPSEIDLRPANVVIFEIYLLSGVSAMHDTVVGWAALPICTTEFSILEGRFKIPFLRGDIDHTISKYYDIEHMYTMDLSAWLCNVYITVKHLPRERLDKTGVLQREFDVELDFMNQLLKLESADRELLVQKEYNADGPVQQTTKQAFYNQVTWGQSAATIQRRNHKRKSSSKVLPSNPEDIANAEEICASDDLKPKKPVHRSWHSWFRRKKHSSKHIQVASKNKEDTINLIEKESPREDEEPDINEPVKENPGNSMHMWEAFTFTTNKYLDETVAKHQRFAVYRKLRYLRQELFADLGFKKSGTLSFWLMICLLLVALWLRIYVHYLGQWLYLRSSNVPVFAFEPYLTTCVLKYIWNTVPSTTEIGCICIGVLFNMFTFIVFMLIAFVCQRFIGEFPELGSRFIACFGFGTVLDPILIFLIDLLEHNYSCNDLPECADSSSASCKCYEGDAFKLYSRYVKSEGSGIVGAVLTLLLYGILFCTAAVLFYTYLLHLHMNGRMLDIYRRIHARNGSFFVPHDFEVSAAEVSKLCERASKWKSIRGATRKTAVCDYELRDPIDPSFVEVTTHIAIFTLELDGSRQLYRHFIKNPDGEILEVFGTLSDSFGSQYAALETALFQTQPEDEVAPSTFDIV
ncbi:hypothetical protein THRCLA_01644 [Thraustotheca clavata]|uniref:Uncharacterized protein n=1 Tax=Thraustotheca clavata TaxID=74557 RepID=A0A1W0A7V9_9STRA|nr:hypothetical protein THRCLA_01644 [Thraustotheca clavata]